MSYANSATNYADVMREQRHQQYVTELRDAGWVVLHESDFTVESFHTDPYFHAVVERVVRWYENPTDPLDPEELARLVRILTCVTGVALTSSMETRPMRLTALWYVGTVT